MTNSELTCVKGLITNTGSGAGSTERESVFGTVSKFDKVGM